MDRGELACRFVQEVVAGALLQAQGSEGRLLVVVVPHGERARRVLLLKAVLYFLGVDKGKVPGLWDCGRCAC